MRGTTTLLIAVAFIFVWSFWLKVVKQIETELINKGKGKKQRNKIHCKRKESGCSKLNFFQSLPWMNENKVQTQDTKRKRY